MGKSHSPIPQHRTLPDATKAELNFDPKPTFQPVWRLHVAGKFIFSKQNPKSSWKRIRPYLTVPAHPSYVVSTWKWAGKSHPTVRYIAAWADTTKSVCVSNIEPKKQLGNQPEKSLNLFLRQSLTKKISPKTSIEPCETSSSFFFPSEIGVFWVGLIWKFLHDNELYAKTPIVHYNVWF